jgi:AcrR family transcriptional regulator
MPRTPVVPGVDRRQQLLESALAVFAEKGFEAATTKEIAQRVGIKQGLLYFYFESKVALFFAVFRHYGQLVQTQLEEIFEQEMDEDPAADLQRLLRQILAVLNTPTAIQLLRLLHQMASSGLPGGFPPMLSQVAGGGLPEAFPPMSHHLASSSTPKGTPHDQAEPRPSRPLALYLIHRLTIYLDAQVARGKLRPVKTDLAATLITRSLISPFSSNVIHKHYSVQEQAEMIVTLFCYGLLFREPPPGAP